MAQRTVGERCTGGGMSDERTTGQLLRDAIAYCTAVLERADTPEAMRWCLRMARIDLESAALWVEKPETEDVA